ncbi:hypothetical protein Glove_319g165 [Diversispora epigaea]|uniref:Bromodomain associated domain-containing protein n=1 Tax=Diversispora epigaea TaxID=1348612 RepID=A0A397HPR8_9GLOM|nr:hypothetical protein Glove_319g165 [Diversispora epigaea]
MDKFCAEYLRRSAHQVLTSAGFEKSSRIAGEVFADVLKDYLLCLGKSAHECATNTRRIKITSTDVLAAFGELGINIEELKDWASSEGKILGKFLGPQPYILKDLLRRGLPGYSADNDNMSNNNNDNVDNNKSSSVVEIKLDDNIVDETLSSNDNSIETIENIETTNAISSEDNDNDHQDKQEMQDQIMGSLSQTESLEKMDIDDDLNLDMESSEQTEQGIDYENKDLEKGINIKNDNNNDNNDDDDDGKESIKEDNNNNNNNKTTKNMEIYNSWPQKRPSYIPEWFPPFPEINKFGEKENQIINGKQKIEDTQKIDKDTIIVTGDNDNDNIMDSKKITSLTSSSSSSSSFPSSPSHDNKNPKSKLSLSRRVKRSSDQRPPTCDQFVNLYKSISHSEPILHDSIETPKKKCKLKISPSSLFPSHYLNETTSKFDEANPSITTITTTQENNNNNNNNKDNKDNNKHYKLSNPSSSIIRSQSIFKLTSQKVPLLVSRRTKSINNNNNNNNNNNDDDSNDDNDDNNNILLLLLLLLNKIDKKWIWIHQSFYHPINKYFLPHN